MLDVVGREYSMAPFCSGSHLTRKSASVTDNLILSFLTCSLWKILLAKRGIFIVFVHEKCY